MKEYPLHWPENWPRNKQPAKSAFKTTLNGAIKNVQNSLKLFASDSGHKVENVIISSNVSLMNENPKDAGVAIYFTWDGIATCIAVDRYLKLEENLQAIHHVIEAERTKLRHGGLNLVRAAFRGYAALPAPASLKTDPFEFLGLDKKTATAEDIERAYKTKARSLHPDGGGSTADFQKLQEAKASALKAVA